MFSSEALALKGPYPAGHLSVCAVGLFFGTGRLLIAGESEIDN